MSTPIKEGAGALEHRDPNTLEIDANVRTEARLTKAFVNSVTENGVLVPITAVRGADGVLRVRTGQRRTLAAREAGLATVPVYVLDAGDDTVQRLTEQIVENDHRSELTDTERVFGIQQILDAGMSVTKTAKKLAVPSTVVKAAKAVVGSQGAIDALAGGQVSLLEAAVIAEFDGDERAVERLLRAAGTSRFEHQAAEVRAAREEAAQLVRAEQIYAEKGYTILTEQPASFDPHCVPLHQLLRADGSDAAGSDVISPAHWAVLLGEDSVLTDKASGEPVDEEDIDWSTEGRPDAEPDEGLRHFDSVHETTGFVPEYFCLDFQAAGLVPNERYVRLGGVRNFPGVDVDGASGDGGSGVSADELAAAQAAAVDEKADAEKRERRKVLALNRLGDAAIAVRREFVTKLLARKTAPKGSAVFVARTLASDGYLLTNYKADEVTAELLGVKPRQVASYGSTFTEDTGGPVGLLEKANEARAAVVTLGLLLGALEARTPKDAWREHHSSQWSSPRFVGAPAYLGFLAEQGYELADVEKVIVGDMTSDEVYDAWLAEK